MTTSVGHAIETKPFAKRDTPFVGLDVDRLHRPLNIVRGDCPTVLRRKASAGCACDGSPPIVGRNALQSTTRP
jgi:hypothetical protein